MEQAFPARRQNAALGDQPGDKARGRNVEARVQDGAARIHDLYLEHMAAEERDILPAARAHFSAADWADMDAAFLANRDPLTGHEPEEGYRPLFKKIVNSAPAPIGLGPAQ